MSQFKVAIPVKNSISFITENVKLTPQNIEAVNSIAFLIEAIVFSAT